MRYSFGIDFGTTTTAISKVVEFNSDPEILELIGDSKTVDTVVQFTSEGEIACVGKEAWESLNKDYERTALNFKLEIGKGGRFENFPHSADTIAMLFLSYLRERLERQLNEKTLSQLAHEHDVKIVIGHPAGWEDWQKQAVISMAEEAGFPNVTGCAEPLGAVYFHHHRKELWFNEKQYVLVYDFGGGTTDVAIMEIMSDDLPAVIAVASNSRGGKDFDARIELLWKNEILRDSSKKRDMPLEDLANVRRAARELKEKLSGAIMDGKPYAEKTIPFLHCKNGEHTLKLTREVFEEVHKIS